ncbi:MAG TPA: hypothetical protein VFD70_30995 [Anaerolineae bacterium]|nr:hypothetical protein [Anaerolineae bacterium]
MSYAPRAGVKKAAQLATAFAAKLYADAHFWQICRGMVAVPVGWAGRPQKFDARPFEMQGMVAVPVGWAG